MSMSALLLAVQDRLRNQLNLSENECRVMPDEKAIPIAGREFVSIYGSLWGQGDPDIDMGIDEYYDVDCTIVHRLRFAPQDRWGSDIYIKTTTGLENRARQIITAVHKNYTVLSLANARIPEQHKIIEPLRFVSASPSPNLVTNDHYQGDVGDDNEGPVGMAITVSFKDARRVQTITGASDYTGGTYMPITTVTTTYTTLSTDVVIFADATAGAFTITLRAASVSGNQYYYIKKIDTTSNVVTVDGNASETIDEELTKQLASPHQAVMCICDGSEWRIL